MVVYIDVSTMVEENLLYKKKVGPVNYNKDRPRFLIGF